MNDQTVILNALMAVQKGQERLEALIEALGDAQGAARSAIMARIDRVQDTLTEMRGDLTVNFGQAESVRVAHDNTRLEMRAITDQLAAMERQIQRLQTAVRELRGE